jgi:hypothetical protein
LTKPWWARKYETIDRDYREIPESRDKVVRFESMK